MLGLATLASCAPTLPATQAPVAGQWRPLVESAGTPDNLDQLTVNEANDTLYMVRPDGLWRWRSADPSAVRVLTEATISKVWWAAGALFVQYSATKLGRVDLNGSGSLVPLFEPQSPPVDPASAAIGVTPQFPPRSSPDFDVSDCGSEVWLDWGSSLYRVGAQKAVMVADQTKAHYRYPLLCMDGQAYLFHDGKILHWNESAGAFGDPQPIPVEIGDDMQYVRIADGAFWSIPNGSIYSQSPPDFKARVRVKLDLPDPKSWAVVAITKGSFWLRNKKQLVKVRRADGARSDHTLSGEEFLAIPRFDKHEHGLAILERDALLYWGDDEAAPTIGASGPVTRDGYLAGKDGDVLAVGKDIVFTTYTATTPRRLTVKGVDGCKFIAGGTLSGVPWIVCAGGAFRYEIPASTP